jgi:hypothetical protein
MILTLIKKINIIINDLLNLLQNSNIYINKKYDDFSHILADDKINIQNLISLSEYIYIINNYIFNLIIFQKQYFNKNIYEKINEININITDIINIVNKNDIFDDICTYIKNSNDNEYLHILYLLFITKSNNKCIINVIAKKMNNNNVYFRNSTVYNYDSLILNKHKLNPYIGLTSDFIEESKYINNTADYIQLNKNNINTISDNVFKNNKFINEFINNYYDSLQLTEKEYNNIGVLIDYGKSVEIQLYNDYTRRQAYNKGNMNNTDISVFELFNL